MKDCHLFMESLTDYAMFMLDTDGRVASWNHGAELIWGYTAQEIVGQHLARLYTPDDAPEDSERELDTVRAFGRAESEGWRVRKDGSRFWANVITVGLRGEDGELRGFGRVTRDVTAKRLAEDELRQSEQRFHGLVDAVVDYAIFMLDAGGHVSTWNAGAARLKGYAAHEIIGEHFSTFYTPEDRAAGKPERVLDTVRRLGRFEQEGWRVRKDGSRFWANVVITALRDADGTVTGFAKVTRDLTERRRADQELRNAEERFRLLVENVSDYAIYLLDLEGRVATWNAGAERMKGYTAQEIIGRSFAVFFPPADVAAEKPARELEAARTGGRFEDEGWRVRKDGSRFWANALLTALHDDDGRLLGFAKITRDLTARRETEEKERQLVREHAARSAAEAAERRIRESEERYRALSGRLKVVFEGVADAILARDGAGRVVFANGAAAAVFGFESPEELMHAEGDVVSARFDRLDRDERASALPSLRDEDFFAEGAATAGVLHLRDRRNGVDRWVSIRSSTVSGGGGEPELVISIWHDVTAERRQERQTRFIAEATGALARSLDEHEMLHALAEALVPALGDWCALTLVDGAKLETVAVVHREPERAREAEHFHGRLLEAAAPRAPRHVIRDGQTELLDFDDALLDSLSGDAGERERLRGLAPESALIVPIKLRGQVLGVMALFLEHGVRRHDWMQVAVSEEICRRTAAALENARLYAAARQAAVRAEEASRAKDEFLATVSHELRTPLTAILGWARLLKDRSEDAAITKPIEVIYRNALAQAKIIDDILDVSRVITGKFRIETAPTDLLAVIRDALEVVRPSALAKNITLEFEPELAFCTLVADPERLQQAIWNLLSNAVKFTDGGKITVTLARDEAGVAVSVEDTGAGIEPQFLPFVFDRFRQADATTTRRIGGLGLGLAIVRHIVELHGGSVAAASEGPGKGAKFTLRLPLRAEQPAFEPDADSTPPPPPASANAFLTGVKILAIDDEEDARELMLSALAERGAIVKTAPSAQRGFEIFREFRPHVVVSDIGMPGEDGYSFIARVRSLPPDQGGDVPALALTAFARPEDGRRALAAGYTLHAGKPIDPATLSAMLSRLTNRSDE